MPESVWLVRWVDECDMTIIDSAWTSLELANQRSKQLERQFKLEHEHCQKCLQCPVQLKTFESLESAKTEISKYCKNFCPENWDEAMKYCECKNSSACDLDSKTVLSPTEVKLNPMLEGNTDESVSVNSQI